MTVSSDSSPSRRRRSRSFGSKQNRGGDGRSQKLEGTFGPDRAKLRRLLRKRAPDVADLIAASKARVAERLASTPKVSYPEELPFSERVGDIRELGRHLGRPPTIREALEYLDTTLDELLKRGLWSRLLADAGLAEGFAAPDAAGSKPDDGKLTIAKLVDRLGRKGIGVTASEGTYLVDDGAGGSLAFDDAARVRRVANPTAEGYVVQARSKALTSVGWIGRSDGDAWVVRGLSVNDCPARIQIEARQIALQYGGQEVRLPLGGGLLTDVELAVPERATRLEVDPLGLSFGERDAASGATHCRTGWWGRRVVLRRLPVGRYTLRWIGEGVAQTATLDVTNEGLTGGKLVRRTGRPAP